MKRFGSYDNGFTLKFDNGLVLSTRFGFSNYCENSGVAHAQHLSPRRCHGAFRHHAEGQPPLFSEDCEVAVWDSTATTFDVEEHENHDWATGLPDGKRQFLIIRRTMMCAAGFPFRIG